MRRLKGLLIGLAAAALIGGGVVSAQLPNYPSGIGTFTSNVYAYFFGGTWTPNASPGGLFGFAATLQPQTGGAQTINYIDVSPTVVMSGVATSIAEWASFHATTPIATLGGSATIGNLSLLKLDAPGTAASFNYSLWNKGAERRDGDLWMNGNNLAMALTTNVAVSTGTFGTAPTIAGNQTSFTINVGSTAATSGIVNFGTPFTHIPNCIPNAWQAQTTASASPARVTSATVSSIKISGDLGIPFPAATTISVLCIGY